MSTARYNTEHLKYKALDAIGRHKCIFIQDIIDVLKVPKKTFYRHQLHLDDDILIELDNNRFSMKNAIRKRWFENPNTTSDIILYKLLGNQEERAVLNLNRNENVNYNVDVKADEMSEEELKDLAIRISKVFAD